MAASHPKFKIPPGQSIAAIKLINAVNFGPATLKGMMGPPIPHVLTFGADLVPSLSFLLEHSSGRRLVWDLGIRKDWHNHAPKIAEYIPTRNYTIEVTKNVIDVLEENGIKGSSVEAVIWSHWHWDHIGDPSTFPSTTDLIVGPGFKKAFLPGAPLNPDSPLLESDWTGRNLREVEFSGPQSLTIGRFPAYDYFGDGSFYLLDSPGHAIGHLCGLVRTTTNPDTFVMLGGDICHHHSVFRPSQHLPLPSSILPNPITPERDLPFCPGSAYEELQKDRGMDPQGPILKPEFGHEIPLALHTIGKLQELDVDENILVIIAHDKYARNTVDHFPLSLNSWKERGWGKTLTWAFLKDFEPYWRSKGVVSD
ncbi:Uncharacterized protein BP5553_10684 [Venustampulla echinocandica]|uniref:Metallo-beta-lactamase domain-containing protein n=1 Tax=Venustampulla echinocandica TaxID=2656787 RepID=A0A370T8S3_9HELO|nr:Uncharacterized protein BP5553_10684 [Venustampulla echinocandica]RDL29819.1 Uncharacterized protein BP5553_10684 [Venustampulla echinocandica]